MGVEKNSWNEQSNDCYDYQGVVQFCKRDVVILNFEFEFFGKNVQFQYQQQVFDNGIGQVGFYYVEQFFFDQKNGYD